MNQIYSSDFFMRFALSLLLLCTSVMSMPAFALFGNNNNAPTFGADTNTFVPVNEAFTFNSYQQGNLVFLDWQVKPGYYLYQERISISAENVTIDPIEMRNGEPHQDEFFGNVHVYTEPLFVDIPLSHYQAGARVIVQYQGCAKAGFCYPPETRVINVAPFSGSKVNTQNKTPNQLDSTAQVSSEQPSQLLDSNQQRSQLNNQQTHDTQKNNNDSSLVSKLESHWWTPILFLALGVGLAFTPCVLPMYPILTSIVLGNGKLSHRRALALSFIYVQGMALTYTILGLVVASAGMQFQAAMQHPYVLIGLSVMFIALALSMFGVYSLQLPSGMQTWLNNLSNKQQGGHAWGAFAMGAISGLVCSPCTTAPLSGALLYVAQSGDLLTGGVALYALALGMGIPLILVAVFGNKLLPKAGSWMDKIKVIFGFILLAAPLFLLERILPEVWATGLWATLGLVAFGWLYHTKNTLPFGGWKQSVVGIIAVLGLFASAQPILNFWFAPQHETSAVSHVQFIKIENTADLDKQLKLAKESGKAVMLDFYADWCVACKEFEKYTFHQPDVAGKLENIVLLQADVTRNRPQDIELLSKMNVLGLPTIEFWDQQGNPIPAARITGFMKPTPFLDHLNHYKL